MQSTENTPDEYRRQADRARRLAGKASDGASRQTLLDQAEKYEELADQCSGDTQTQPGPNHPRF